ncbi:MAG: antibiotic biosynthesis monooxygenase [Terriglobales bacterium]
MSGQPDRWGYLVMWEFVVKPGMEARFEQIYGASGDWARLFRHDENYLGTELNCEHPGSRRYLTLDFWASEEAYEGFQKKHLAEYQAIDQSCEALTESECKLATFTRAV